MLGGRSPRVVLREAFEPRNYRALARMARSSPEPLAFARRYFLGGGSYPYRCPVRTPLGLVAPTLFSHHDVWTVNEIFFREDYFAGPDLRVAVDLGSNIGISALYFLTRNASARSYLYEPDPRNVERLRANLAPYEGRWELEEVAVAPSGGEVDFGRDPTGRYGGVGLESKDTIRVRAVSVGEVLDHVLAREPAIDVLKVDIEGLERETVAAIRPEHLDRIDVIYFEWGEPAPLHAERYDASFANETVRLARRNAPVRRS